MYFRRPLEIVSPVELALDNNNNSCMYVAWTILNLMVLEYTLTLQHLMCMYCTSPARETMTVQ